MLARDVEARFAALDAFLIEHQGLWRPRPFTHLQLPWEREYPELAQWLRQRTLADAESCHNWPHDLPAPAPFPQLAEQALQLSAVDRLPTRALEPARHRLNVDVPGRKWQQIEAFGAALNFTHTPGHWLDWCAGKGHLGRRLLQPGQQLTCLEHDPALIASGQALSDHHRLPVTHRLQDVMAKVALSPEHTPSPCMPAATCTCACCNWPARPVASNWHWRPAVTTASTPTAIKPYPVPHAHRNYGYRLMTWACR